MNKSLFAAILLALSLAACSSEKTEATVPAASEAAPATATDAAPLSAEDAEKEKIRKQNEAAEAALSGH
ncbi:conserved hypothetical protein [Herminiimonas arsenicoxydans]|uniref:Lipoprotein n=1 Tax=Herminiimonas arsenicoxydans TaxID=204773 RepID=A4G3K9_HERAR|nr:conserved hypothetical protein [Herminiimonas arsenicoxydans]